MNANRFDTLTRSVDVGLPRRAALRGLLGIGWERFVGERGAVVGIDRYGASAPGAKVLEHFGFTPERVAATALRLLGRDALAAKIGPQ